MRDKNRIGKTITLIREIWESNPDLRFGQLVSTLYKSISSADIFFIEDDKLINFLNDFKDFEDKDT